MNDPANQSGKYKMLAMVFGVAGIVWIVYGFLSPHFIFYPLIGLANLGIAFVCKLSSV
jgi:energy-converting hydrogenase Eha subunit H